MGSEVRRCNQPMEVRMRIAIIALSILLITWPNKANAKDGTFEEISGAGVAVYTVIGSAFIIPFMGSLIDNEENSPYWKAVGFTFISSSAGVGFAYLLKDNSLDRAGDPHAETFVYPLLFGAAATYLTYRNAPRRTNETSSALWQYTPQVSVLPDARGGSIRLNWSF